MSIFSDLKPTNHAPRNGFDLGRFSTFSTKAGYIIPVFSQATIPSAEYSLDIKQLLRSQPLQKAAFTGFSINYDVIWSPYNHLYSSFNQFIAQRSNKNVVNQPTHLTIPTFNLGIFFRYVFTCALQDYMLSFCRGGVVWENQECIIRNDHMPHESVALNVLRNIDMFNYGNLLPLLKNTYRTICDTTYTITAEGEDPVTVKLDPTSFSHEVVDGKMGVLYFLWHFVKLGIDDRTGYNNDSFAEVHTYWMRFLDGLNTGVYTNPAIIPQGGTDTISEILDTLNTSQCNLFAPLAYNKAYYEYYRNTYFDDKYQLILATDHSNESNRINTFDYVQLFNLDDNPELGHYEGSTQVPADFHQLMRLFAIFDVKPHLYKRDLFTGVLPSTQFGDVSVMVTDDMFRKLIGNVTSEFSASVEKGQVYSNNNAGANVRTIPSSGTPSGVIADKYKFEPALAISVLESRRADAMQRFKERMMRAGDKTKDIFKAHGWDEPKSELSYEPIFLGSFDGRLDINVVASTTESDDVQLAQLGANGMAVVNGSKVKIKTSDFGVLIVLMHIEKDAVYDSYGVEIAHTLNEPFDYPYPELQNISLAPIDVKYLNLLDKLDARDIIGYLPRAIGFKTAVDKVHGEFYSSMPYNYNDLRDPNHSEAIVMGAFSDWVAPREDLLNFHNKSFLYVSPRCTDTIFKQLSNVRQDSDQFFVNARFDCYAVEPLPVIGLPI